MATIAFPEQAKTLKLPSSTTYTYLHIPAKSSQPTLLFLHGFPSSSYDWRRQIEYFSPKGYGILAPDLLGYGGTDRPSLLEYSGKKMASDLVELLEHEKIGDVHVIGHDWGCFPVSRLANYYPKRFLTLSFLDIPYRPPGQPWDLDAVNKFTKENMGFEVFGYWYFFEKEGTGKLCGENVRICCCVTIIELMKRGQFESFFSLIHPEDPATWAKHFAPTGAIDEWVMSNRVGPLAGYWTEEVGKLHLIGKLTLIASRKNQFIAKSSRMATTGEWIGIAREYKTSAWKRRKDWIRIFPNAF